MTNSDWHLEALPEEACHYIAGWLSAVTHLPSLVVDSSSSSPEACPDCRGKQILKDVSFGLHYLHCSFQAFPVLHLDLVSHGRQRCLCCSPLSRFAA